METTEGNTTDDLQDGRCTCLESKPTRHQLQKNKIYTEPGSEDPHWLSYDVQYQSPTHRRRDAEHSELLSAQYLARCLEPENVCHSIITRANPKRQMKETLYTRHRNTVEPMMVKRIGKLHSTLTQSLTC